ncbi:MAG: beta-galactosidase [Kofleriaceae bacterium]|nr:beta-galactosidase [Kofleriaceae bacterium]MCL4224123.1 beta-galactosidase [Myxococcales bacterium]
MEARRRTWFDDRGLVLAPAPGDAAATPRRLPFLGAAVHYWRTPRALWRRALDELAALGVTLVESYVPWSVHERGPGVHDWRGDRDLGVWLDEVAAAGLVAALRPGPHINAELTGFGFPDRIVRDPDIQARAAHGGPVWLPAPPRAFPVPSYASAKLHDEVAAWFRAVGEVVAPRRWPDGPVVALQVDNEPQLFFRLGAFDHDYHPDALAAWRAATGDDEDAPRAWSPEGAATCARWVRWKDELLAQALARFGRALDAAGLDGLARYGNLPPGEPWFTDLPRLERAVGGPVGLDVYAGGGALDPVRRRALHLAGSTAHLPLVPELGCGFVPYAPPFSDDEQRAVTLALLAGGVRGLSFYMGMCRDRWMGGILDEEARPRPTARWVGRVLAALAELDWTALRRRARVALVLSRADARHGLASSLVDPLPPVAGELLGLGPAGSAELARDPAAALHRRWFDAAARALDLARVPYVIVDEGAALDRLLEHDAIVAPTLHRVDRALWRRLGQVAAARKVVVLGPETPSLDEWGEPLGEDAAVPRRAGFMSPGSLDDIAGLAADLAALAPVEDWYVERPSAVHAAAFADDAGAVRALILVNPGERPVTARLMAPPGTTLRDALGTEALGDAPADAGAIAVALAARDARLFRVEARGGARAAAADQKK